MTYMPSIIKFNISNCCRGHGWHSREASAATAVVTIVEWWFAVAIVSISHSSMVGACCIVARSVLIRYKLPDSGALLLFFSVLCCVDGVSVRESAERERVQVHRHFTYASMEYLRRKICYAFCCCHQSLCVKTYTIHHIAFASATIAVE